MSFAPTIAVRHLALGLATAMFAAGCGKSSPQKIDSGAAMKPQTAGLNATSSCNAQKCNKVDMDVSSSGFGGPDMLIGIVGEPVPWDLQGTAIGEPDRRVGILLDDFPEGAVIDPKPGKELAAAVNIVWTPTKTLKNASGTPLRVYLRDMDYCLANEKDASDCQAYENLKKYDKVIELRWEVKERGELEDLVSGDPSSNVSGNGPNVVNVSDPNCTGRPPAMTSTDIKNKLLQNLITPGALLPSLLNGLLNNNSNVPNQPTPC